MLVEAKKEYLRKKPLTGPDGLYENLERHLELAKGAQERADRTERQIQSLQRELEGAREVVTSLEESADFLRELIAEHEVGVTSPVVFSQDLGEETGCC